MKASNFNEDTAPYTKTKRALTKLQSLRRWHKSEQINYEISLSTKEPILTPKEYRTIRDCWQTNFKISILQDSLKKHAEPTTCSLKLVIENLLNHSLDDYKKTVSKITQCKTTIEANHTISKAENIIRFIADLNQPRDARRI